MSCYKKLLFLVTGAFLYVGQLFGNPAITSISPNAGPEAGGTIVSINGSGFTGATAVKFGTTPAASFTVNTDASISATSPPGVIGPVHITVTVGANTSPQVQADAFVYQGGWIAYLPTHGANNLLIPIIVATNTAGTNIPTGIEGSFIAITPDGTTAYVTSLSQDTVTPITLATGAVGASIPVGTGPEGIAITPDGKTAYVCNASSGSISPIDIATNTAGTAIPMGSHPVRVAITPDGKTAYIADSTDSTVTPITIATNTPGTPILLGGGTAPQNIAITPDGKTAYVCQTNFPAGVTPIDIATNVAGSLIAAAVFGIAITPDGKTAYTSDPSSQIVPFDIATSIVGTPIAIDIGAVNIAITPDGSTAYPVLSFYIGGHVVQAVDIITSTAGVTINVPPTILGIAISPDPAPLASFTVIPAPLGSPSTFDASASVSAVGTIASYAWDFGDGNLLTTASPVTTHTYTSGNVFTARLTVTNSAGTSTSQVFTGQTVSQQGSSFATTTQTVTLPIIIIIQPPSNVSGVQKPDHFLTQTDLVNVITWNPPALGEAPAFYNVYRDNLTNLIAVVSADAESLSALDHNRKKGRTYTYYLVSVGAGGTASAAQSVIVRPN